MIQQSGEAAATGKQEATDEECLQFARMIAQAKRITLFTGAGISTESGIADFRSPGGIWSQMKPIQYQDFLDNEATRLEDWRRRFHFQAEFDAAPINAGHKAVAHLVNGDKGHGLITQNIDGLHQRSGITDDRIIEIHGNGTSCACLTCKSHHTLAAAKLQIEATGASPKCTRCGGLLKAAVISFGQPMPQDRVKEAAQLAKTCDLFIVLGSSLVVTPAARMPLIAQQAGARLVILNRQTTPLDPMANLIINAPIGRTLERVVSEVPTIDMMVNEL